MGEWIDERGERKVVWGVLGWRKKWYGICGRDAKYLAGPQIEARYARQLYYQTDLCTANLLAAHESLLHP